MKYFTVEELAQGKGMTQNMIKKCVQNANVRKSQHRDSWNGWTKNKRMRSEVRIPTWLYLQPAIQEKYFPENADEHEKAKGLEMFKRDFPRFVTHD